MLTLLPVTAPTFHLFVGEDWLDGVLFHLGGQPIDISTIAFEVDLWVRGATAAAASFSTAGGTMLAVCNSLQMNVAASALSSLSPGGYRVLMFGSQDGQRRLLWDGRLALIAGGA